MTAPTLRQHMIDTLAEGINGNALEVPQLLTPAAIAWIADALLASPELQEIIDVAAERIGIRHSKKVRALLADWRANRAEQEPER
jgi:hypothetical protein